jgi:hypothetical protein
METNDLRLSPLALQTALLRRWRAELGISFFGNVIAFRRSPPSDGKRLDGLICRVPVQPVASLDDARSPRREGERGNKCRMVGA